MIYLIRSYGLNGKSILKVGYTDSPGKRFETYFYHNPEIEVISVREGDEVLENLLHVYLGSLGFKYKKDGKLNEWFVNDPRVYQIFHIHRKDLEKKIWRSRNKIFDPSKLSLPSSPQYNLFEYLWKKNKDRFTGEREIYRNGRYIRTRAKKVDIAFWGSRVRGDSRVMDDFLDSL